MVSQQDNKVNICHHWNRNGLTFVKDLIWAKHLFLASNFMETSPVEKPGRKD